VTLPGIGLGGHSSYALPKLKLGTPLRQRAWAVLSCRCGFLGEEKPHCSALLWF